MATILDLSTHQPPSVFPQVPSEMVDGRWRFTAYPTDSSATIAGVVGNQTLFAFGDDGGYQLNLSGTGTGCTVVAALDVFGPGTRSYSQALTFSAGQPLTFEIDTRVASLTISGATTGNGVLSLGTAFQFPNTALYIGVWLYSYAPFSGTLSDVVNDAATLMRAIEALDNSNVYTLANPGGSRGTVNVGTVHVQAWVTVRTQAVSSATRFIYSTEASGAVLGMTLQTSGTNDTLSLHSQGVTGGTTISVPITVAMTGRPLHVVGAIDAAVLKLWVDGVRATDVPLTGGTGYYAVPTGTIAIGKRFGGSSEPLGTSVAVHGVATGNFGNITNTEATNAYANGIYARDIVAIPAKTGHLWSAKQDKGANSTLLDRVGTDHFARTGLPIFLEEWAAWDELTDSNYYQMAVAGGSLGTVNVGNLHAQVWVTVESQAVASSYRFIYCSEDFNTGSGYGMSIFVYGTNQILVVHCRGISGDWSNEYTIPADLVGTPFQVVGIVDNAVLRLYVNGALATVDQPLPVNVGYYALPTVAIAVGKRPNGTGDSVTGDIKIHGVSTGNTVPTAAEVYGAYTAALAAKDIVAIGGGKTAHLWSARLDGSAASSSTDRVGSSSLTRTGQPAYISAVTYATGQCVMTPTTSAGTVTLALALVGAATMDPLTSSGEILAGASLTGASSMAALESAGTLIVGGSLKTVWTPTGTTHTTDEGELVTDQGALVVWSEYVRNKIRLGILRTSSPDDAPIINRPAVDVTGASSMDPLTSSGTVLVGVLLDSAAAMSPLTSTGVLTLAAVTLAGASSMAPLTSSGTLSVPSATILKPFCVGSHSNERALFASMVAGGVQRIRMDIEWRQVESTQGSFTWSESDLAFNEADLRGLEIHVVVGYTAQWASANPGDTNYWNWGHKEIYESQWQNYIQQVFNRYGGRAASWEIWNEPDHDNFLKIGSGGTYAENHFPGETAVNKKRIQYKRMVDLAMAQPAVSGKLVTTSGFAEGGGYDTGFVEYLRTQSSNQWFKQFGVANYHGYGYTSYQRLIDQPAHWNSVESSIGWVAEHWITEHGIPQTGVADADIKTYLIRSFALALQQPNVTKMFWFRAGYDPVHRDLYDNSSNPTAAYYAMQLLASKCSSPTSFASFSSGTARGAVVTRAGALPQMAVLWADSFGAAINSYGLNIATCWDQDGNVISTATGLTARPVFAQLDAALPNPGAGNALLVNASGAYLLNANGDYLYGKQ